MSDDEPSHGLVYNTSGWGSPEHNQLVLAVFEAGSAHADEAHFRLDRDLLRREEIDREVLERVDAVFDRPDDGGEVIHTSRDIDSALNVLEELMDPRTVFTAVAARYIVLVSDGKEVLTYGPEHQSITVYEDRAPGIVDRIATAVESFPAVLIPNCPIVEWECDDRKYSIGEKVCIEGSGTFGSAMHCFPHPDRIDPDEETLTIDLQWGVGDRTVFDRIVGTIGNVIGTSRPRQLTFESKEDFEAGHNALEEILDGLQGNRGTVSSA